MSTVPHYQLRTTSDGRAIIPANFLYLKSLSKYSTQWAINAYDYYRYLDKTQRNESGEVVAPQARMDPQANADDYLKFLQLKIKQLGRVAKATYESNCVGACQDDCRRDGLSIHHQMPQNIKDVFAIYFSPQFQQMAKDDMPRVLNYALCWFHVHVFSANRDWLTNTISQFFIDQDMRVILDPSWDQDMRRRVHSWESIILVQTKSSWISTRT